MNKNIDIKQYRKDVGNKLNYYRRQKGLTQQQVADESEESREFYSYYRELVQESSITDLEAELLLFTILELVGSTCYSCILYEQPLPIEEYMPYLHRSIHHILLSYFNKNEYSQ